MARLSNHQIAVLAVLAMHEDRAPSELGTTWRTIMSLVKYNLVELRPSQRWRTLGSDEPARMPFLTDYGRRRLAGSPAGGKER